MNADPFFSIVVPTYNRAPLLSRTIESILQQTCTDFELLLIDDGSTDDTAQVVRHFSEQDARVRYQHQQNAERGAARNNGIRAAKGQFIIFFDSDDEMRPQYLQILFDGISKEPDHNFYATRYHYIIDGKDVPSSTSGLKEGAYTRDLMLKGNPFSCNFCIRRATPGLRYFRESRELTTMEDWMFLVENLQEKGSIYLIAEDGLGMHHHEGRSMQENDKLITRRLKATQVLEEDQVVAGKDLTTLKAYSWYFCSIHAYLESRRAQSLGLLLKAVGLAGINPLFLKALLKYLAGRKITRALK